MNYQAICAGTVSLFVNIDKRQIDDFIHPRFVQSGVPCSYCQKRCYASRFEFNIAAQISNLAEHYEMARDMQRGIPIKQVVCRPSCLQRLLHM